MAATAAIVLAGCLAPTDVQPPVEERVTALILSTGPDGAFGDGPSWHARASRGGNIAVYYTHATNVIPQDDAECSPREDLSYNCPDWAIWRQGAGTSFLAQHPDGIIPATGTAVTALSADGDRAVFQATAPDGSWGIFLHEVENGTVRRIASPGSPPDRAEGGSYCGLTCGPPTMSFTGRYLTFDTFAEDLVPGDTNRFSDLFLIDLEEGKTERISVPDEGQSDGNSFQLFGGNAVSSDGRWVMFLSTASNLDARDQNECPQPNGEPSSLSGASCIDVFLRDRRTNTTRLAFTALDGKSPTLGAWFATMTGDGKKIVFQSDSNDLVANDTNAASDVFLLDRSSSSVQRISLTSEGLQAEGKSYGPSIDENGTRVVFLHRGSGLTADDVSATVDLFLYDIPTGRLSRIVPPEPASEGSVWDARIGPDGEWVIYSLESRTLGHRQVVLQPLPPQ